MKNDLKSTIVEAYRAFPVRTVASAALPALSFLLIFIPVWINRTFDPARINFTIFAVDWVFIVFNFFMVGLIRYQKKTLLLLLLLTAFAASMAVHIAWSYKEVKDLLLYTSSGAFTFAGYAHLVFSAIEFFFILCYIFAYQNTSDTGTTIVSFTLGLYFVLSMLTSYLMWNAFNADDVLRCGGGFLVVLVLYIARRKRWTDTKNKTESA